MMDINKFVDGQMAAWARNDMIGMLTDAGHALVQTGLKVNGVRYQDVLVGPLLMQAAAALEECWKREGLIQAEAKPDKPGDVVVKITVPDRWPMTEAGQRRAAQEAAAPKPMTNSGGQTMAEYIDRVEYCEKHCRCNNDYCNRQSCPIWEAPAADVAPVVRGRGSGKPMVEPVQPLTAQDAPKPMTNGDRIRAMTDEELAESDELLSGLCNVLHGQGYPCEANTCRECLIKWLGSPEKEAAPEPVTNGDRIQDMKDGELEERERLERLFEEARQIADRRAWDETSRTMADICGQEANDGQ